MYVQLLMMTLTGPFAVDVGPTSDFLGGVFIPAPISYSFSSATYLLRVRILCLVELLAPNRMCEFLPRVKQATQQGTWLRIYLYDERCSSVCRA
jgi:hypothetical protein